MANKLKKSYKKDLTRICISFVFSCMMREVLRVILLMIVLITGGAQLPLTNNNQKKLKKVLTHITIYGYIWS